MEPREVDRDALPLHFREHRDERNLDIVQQRDRRVDFRELRLEQFAQAEGEVRFGARIVARGGDRHFVERDLVLSLAGEFVVSRSSAAGGSSIASASSACERRPGSSRKLASIESKSSPASSTPARRSTSRSYFALCAVFLTFLSASSARSGSISGDRIGGRFLYRLRSFGEHARRDARRGRFFRCFRRRAEQQITLRRLPLAVRERQIERFAGRDRDGDARRGSRAAA